MQDEMAFGIGMSAQSRRHGEQVQRKVRRSCVTVNGRQGAPWVRRKEGGWLTVLRDEDDAKQSPRGLKKKEDDPCQNERRALAEDPQQERETGGEAWLHTTENEERSPEQRRAQWGEGISEGSGAGKSTRSNGLLSLAGCERETVPVAADAPAAPLEAGEAVSGGALGRSSSSEVFVRLNPVRMLWRRLYGPFTRGCSRSFAFVFANPLCSTRLSLCWAMCVLGGAIRVPSAASLRCPISVAHSRLPLSTLDVVGHP